MKIHLIISVLVFWLIGSTATYAAEVYSPESFSADRYQHIWEKRPFSPATPTVTAPPEDGIEQQYALCGLVKMADQWVAFVLNRKTLERLRVYEASNETGLQLVSVQEEANSKDSTIVLRAKGQTGIVRFDPTLLNAPPVKDTASKVEKKVPTEMAAASAGKPSAEPALTSSAGIARATPRQGQPSAARTLRRNPVNLSP